MNREYTAEQAWNMMLNDDETMNGYIRDKGTHGIYFGSDNGIMFACAEPGCCDHKWTNKEEFIQEHLGYTFKT